MKITDCHIHMEGDADPKEVLKQMDSNGIDRILVISGQERKSLVKTKENLLRTKKLFDAAPGRISGLAWIEPTLKGSITLAEKALMDMGFAGIKIIPDHWYAYEKRLEPFWKKMNELKASILFHAGILHANDDGSRFCQPVNLEKLMFYPNIRFAMAHISWPWCEECLAVMGRMRAAVNYDVSKWQSYIDLTPGTPRHIVRQALANAIDMFGPDRIMFGTDNRVPGDFGSIKGRVVEYISYLDELKLNEAQKERVMSGTANELFPVK